VDLHPLPLVIQTPHYNFVAGDIINRQDGLWNEYRGQGGEAEERGNRKSTEKGSNAIAQ
jgi:hypothetical protein